MKLPYNNTNIFVFYFDPLFIRLHRSALPLPLLSSPCLSSLPLCLCCCRRRCFSPPVVVMPTSQEMALSWLHSSRADQLMSGTVQACAQIPPPTLLPSPPPPPSVNVVVVPQLLFCSLSSRFCCFSILSLSHAAFTDLQSDQKTGYMRLTSGFDQSYLKCLLQSLHMESNPPTPSQCPHKLS